MGLLDNLRKKKELQRLEKAAEESPSPQTLSALSERCFQVGDLERALEVAEHALKQFPLSDKVQATFKYIRKAQLQAKIRELNDVIRKNPNPVSYGQLAIIYKDMGETHKAVDVCRELEDRFPLSENSYMIIGEIRERRFREDLLATDGEKAMTNLEHALEINPHNYKALLMLAEIYIRIGAFTLAIERLEKITSFAPTDDRVRSLIEESRELVNPDAEDEVEWLFRDVENKKRFANDIREVEEEGGKLIAPAEGPAPAAPPAREDTVKRRLERFDKLPGFLGALAVDREGKALADKVPFHVNRESFDATIQKVYAVAHNAALRMDVGAFLRAEVRGDFGQLLLSYGDGVILGVMAEAKTRPELLDQAVKQALSGMSAATA